MSVRCPLPGIAPLGGELEVAEIQLAVEHGDIQEVAICTEPRVQ
jgi:hypothetical protein